MCQKVGVVGVQNLVHVVERRGGPCEVKEGIDDGIIEVFGQGGCWTQLIEVLLCDLICANAADFIWGVLKGVLDLSCCVLWEVEGDGVAPWR